MTGPDRVVLYIEDNVDNVRLVELLLTRHERVGLQVAATGAAGVEAATTLEPNLILLDNRLPDMMGADVLGRLQAEPVTAGIPVVVLTGDSDRATADQLLSLGARAFLAKPFDIHELSVLVDRYLP